jgi:hypothetical protein
MQATTVTAERNEPFAGLLPIRAKAPQSSAPVDTATDVNAMPLAATRPIAWGGAAQFGQAMQPVLNRAANITDAALDQNAASDMSDDDDPDPDMPSGATATSTAPLVNNTFNVTVAIGDRASPVDREALRDALVSILRDGARRNGIDI